MIKETNKKIKEGFVGQKMIVLSPNAINYLANNSITEGFQITAIGYYPKAAYHDRQRPAGSKEFILLYCVDGEGQVKVDHQIFNLLPNDFFVIPPFKNHHYRSSQNNPWSIYWVHFKGKVANALIEKFYLRRGLRKGAIAYSEKLLENFREAIDLLSDRFSQEVVEYSSLLIKNFVVHLVYTENHEVVYPEEDTVENAISYLKENLSNEVKIQDFAARFNLSVSRFSEIFKTKTGYSPIKYLILTRIQKACQLLHFTDLSVKEIAIKVGFEDQYYFSRMFKKLMGMPPTSYRKEYNK
jgi:AraC-like DNA-binding protein/mannose-6-phosphate isomerase-like protein (cupin superfamily)